MSTLFISHSSKDNAFADEVRIKLQEQNHHSVFLDFDPEKGIIGGQSWEQTLYRKLRSCQAVVVICTQNHLSSKWCFAEIALARMEGKHVITLLCDPEVDFSNVPSILTDRQIINLTEKKEEGYQRFWRALEAENLMAVEGEWDSNESPYLGLSSFSEKEAPVFFGRDEEIRAGVELLSRGAPNKIMIMGASGSGKSSLVMAGIIPRIRRYDKEWIILDPFRPGSDPFVEFAKVLYRGFKKYIPGDKAKSFTFERIVKELKSDLDNLTPIQVEDEENTDSSKLEDERLHRLIEQIEHLQNQPPADANNRFNDFINWTLKDLQKITGTYEETTRLSRKKYKFTALNELTTQLRQLSYEQRNARVLIVVDQFEEFFGYHDDEKAHHQFLNLLRASLESDQQNLTVLGSMRSDFLGAFQRHRSLHGFDFESLSLGPMSVDNMRKIIESPAKLAALELEEGLPDLLLEDTGTADALPLLSFTLKKMWDDYSDDGVLSVDEYKSLGGLHGAITKEANSILRVAKNKGKSSALRKAFLKMARLSEDGSYARQRVYADTEEIESVRDILDMFIQRRLMFSYEKDNRTVIEVAHEALFRSWKPLKNWLDDNRSEYLFQQQLERDALAWKTKEEQSTDDLWKGGKLQQASGFIEKTSVSDDVQEFVGAGLELAYKENRKKRLRLISIATVIAMLAVVSIFFFWKSKESLVESKMESLLGQALFLSKKDPTTAMHLAQHVFNESDGENVKAANLRKVLYQHFDDSDFYSKIFEGHSDDLYQIASSPDGEHFLSCSKDGMCTVWDKEGDKVNSFSLEDRSVYDILFSPDGKRFIVYDDFGVATFRNIDGTIVNETIVMKQSAGPLELEFSPNGETVLGRGGNSLWIWNSKQDRFAKLLDPCEHDFLDDAFFMDGGKSILTIGFGNICQTDLDGNVLHEFKPNNYNPSEIIQEKNGISVFKYMNRFVVEQFYLEKQDIRNSIRLLAPVREIKDFHVSKNGEFLLMGSMEGKIVLQNLKEENFVVLQNNYEYFSVDFTPNEDYVICLTDHQVFVWDLKGELVNEFYHYVHGEPYVDFLPDGKNLIIEHQNTFILRSLIGEHSTFISEEDWVDVFNVVSICPENTGDGCATEPYVLSASGNRTVKMWNNQGFMVQEYKGHQGEVLAIETDHKNEKFLTGGADSTVIIWDLKGQQLNSFVDFDGPVRELVFSKDGNEFLAVQGDNKLIHMDVNGNLLNQLGVDSLQITAIDLSKDKEFALIGSDYGIVLLWNLKKNSTQIFGDSFNSIEDVQFLGEAEYIGISTYRRECFVNSIAGDSIFAQQFYGYTNVTFSSCGNFILNGPVEIMNLKGEIIQKISELPGDNYSSFKISKDSKHIGLTHLDGKLTVHDCIAHYFDKNVELTNSVVKNLKALNFQEFFASEINEEVFYYKPEDGDVMVK